MQRRRNAGSLVRVSWRLYDERPPGAGRAVLFAFDVHPDASNDPSGWRDRCQAWNLKSAGLAFSSALLTPARRIVSPEA